MTLRASYPPGDTTASRIKALVLWLQAEQDRAAADALIRETRIDPEYLADETRPVPLAVWHRALMAFASRFGRQAILSTWKTVIDTPNLGVWTRVLRGTARPEDAFAQLDAYGGDEPKTSKWETLATRPGFWQGRVVHLHDPTFEADGLCSLARCAELTGIPAMFGYGPGRVERVPIVDRRANTAKDRTPTGVVEEFTVRWRVPHATRTFAGAGFLSVVAAGALWNHGVVAASVGAVAAAIASAALGTVLQTQRQRSAESHAQMTRIRALERSVALKEEHERVAVGFVEGTVIAGKYRIGTKLGAGASGVIHQATRLSDNTPVAIKLLRAAVAHDNLASDRLRREAEALGLTWHPNVVEVYEHDHLPDGTAYLVMEHLDGESLATRLRQRGHLTPAELLPIALQVCDALGAVHAAGVIHRDVKPGNIFLVERDDGTPSEQVKLLDFGIARVEWAETRLTNMGSPLGTPGYMSPEQEQGTEIDARSDLFSLGVVLFECLAGAGNANPISGNYSIRAPLGYADSGLPLSEAAAQIPPGWLEIIQRATAPLPRDRYADARAMREALAELAAATGEAYAGAPHPVPPASVTGERRVLADPGGKSTASS